MELVDSYNCSKCRGTHPLELDQYLKNERIKNLDNMDPCDPMGEVFKEAIKARKLAEIRRVNICFRMSMAEAENRQNTAPAELREKLIQTLKQYPVEFIIYKAIGMRKKLCVKELKEVDKSLRFNQIVTLFTKGENKNVDHWLEITSRSTLISDYFGGKFSTGNTRRIYQFPVKVTAVKSEGPLNCECQVKPVVVFNTGSCSNSNFGPRENNLEFIKLMVIGFQASFSSSEQSRRDTISDLRLVYNDQGTKPKIWIQSPGITHKDPPNSVAKLTPIHCADQSGEFDPYFGTDMKDTRPAPVLETKKKENEDIMERLRRLEMNNN